MSVTQDYKITIVVDAAESFEILFALKEQERLYQSYIARDGGGGEAYDRNELEKVRRVIAIVEKARA